MLTYADASAGQWTQQRVRGCLQRVLLTYADVCWRMLTYADVCWRMLTYADVCWRIRRQVGWAKSTGLPAACARARCGSQVLSLLALLREKYLLYQYKSTNTACSVCSRPLRLSGAQFTRFTAGKILALPVQKYKYWHCFSSTKVQALTPRA